MKQILLFALITLLAPLAHADEDEDDSVAPEAVVLERALGPSAKTGTLAIRVHKAGHLEGKPFVIEIAEACPGGDQILDAHSVCDVAPNTLAFRPAAGEIEMLVRDPAENASGCQLQAKRVVFRVQSRCNP